MTPRRTPLPCAPLLLLLTACAEEPGRWRAEIATTDEIRQGPLALDDGCTFTWEALDVVLTGASLSVPDDQTVEVGVPSAWALLGEPQTIGENEAPATDGAEAGIRPSVEEELKEGNAAGPPVNLLTGYGWSFVIQGAFSCSIGETTLWLGLPLEEALSCGDVAVESGGSTTSRFIFEPDRLFFTEPDGGEGARLGEAYVLADLDGNGRTTEAELDKVQLGTVGYPVNDGSIATLYDLIVAIGPTLYRLEGGDRCAAD